MSPALISHVVVERLGLNALVVDLGCPVAPAVPHLRLAAPAAGGPARCLSGGAALEPARVDALLALGQAWAARQARLEPAAPLLVAECVPGGTTTALALLSGLGVEASGRVSGGWRHPVHAVQADLVAKGLAA
ncbi:MAG: NaMN--DMB phosphoribosyltransferase, partial [Synechococcaceae cyanobacterium]